MANFNQGTDGMYGRTTNAYPPGTQNPKLYVDYYDRVLRGSLAFESEEYVYGKYLDSKTIPSMNDTTITIQKADAVPGAGLSFNPMTGDLSSLNDHNQNGALLDKNSVDSKAPIVLDRMAFKGEVQIWGLWIQFNDIQDITDMYNVLEESVKALARAIAETKDTYTRNFIMINSTKVYANSKTSLDDIVAGDQLTFTDIVTECLKLQRNMVDRRNTDTKDSNWTEYKNKTGSGIISHPAPIKGYKNDENRYKVFLSYDGYNQLISASLFKEYFIAGKSLASNVNPTMVNALSYNSNGEADAFFNFRVIKSPNTWKGTTTTGINYDTAIILPEGTFANITIKGYAGLTFYMFKNFKGSIMDPTGRAGSVGCKWIHGVAKITPYTPAVTLAYASLN